MLLVLDAGAEDLQDADEMHEVVTPVSAFEAVKQAVEEKGIACTQTALVWVPQNMLEVAGEVAEQIVRLLEALEDLDDVQKVFSNFDVKEEEFQKLLA
jgi:transcriptional/translational regulatory protein YebC/TACO1